jgi:hypothetical protein
MSFLSWLYDRIQQMRMKTSAEPFRISFWWLTLYCVGIGTGIAVPLVLGLTLVDSYLGAKVSWRVMWSAIAGAVAGAELVGAFAVWMMWWFRPLYVSPDYLVAFRLGGGYRKALWTEITHVSRVNKLGLRYLRVMTTGSEWPLWVPLYLSNLEGFYWRVCEYAGPEHPLAVALQMEHGLS